MKIEQFNSPKKPVLVEDKSRTSSSTQPATENAKVDQVEISPESVEFTKAIEYVRREIRFSGSIGYIDPPRSLTNGKQLEIIGQRISRRLKNSDAEKIENAAKMLWKETGYRDEKTPPPNPYRDGQHLSVFLTVEDRQKIDENYDADIANGLSEKEAVKNTSKFLMPIGFKRYKELTISLGTTWYSSEHVKSLTREEWDEHVKNLPPEYSDVHGRSSNKETPEDKMKDFQIAQRETLINLLFSGMNESDDIKESYREQLEEIADIIMQNISKQTAED
jgi:hypothetical protein